MRLETVSTSSKKAQDLALIRKVRKEGKKRESEKGRKKKEDSRSSNQGKKDLSHVKCFKCHEFCRCAYIIMPNYYYVHNNY